MRFSLRHLTITLAALVASSVAATAGTVSVQTAQNVALSFFSQHATHGYHTAATATLKYTQTDNTNTVNFYVFDMNPAGFVIVAADDNVTPILGYSLEATFNADFSNNGIGNWMAAASTQIANVISNQVVADQHINSLWTAYKAGNNPGSPKSQYVSPLLTTTWGQYPYYNKYAPYNSTDQQQCLTGCVATGMAQIMKYWNFPAKGTGAYSYTNSTPTFSHNYGNQSANFGNTSYNWTNMPASNIDSTNNDAIAILMYHCGVAVSMDYGDLNQGGSGSHVLQDEVQSWQHSAEMAYASYFGYNASTLKGVHRADYTDADWLALIKNELNAGRPVQYQGEDAVHGGHTWVCDGYDANDMLHMNWGWNGNNNGYFSIANMSAGGYNFTPKQAALIGIQPMVNITASISSNKTTICTGDTAILTGHGPANARFSWTPVDGLSCPTCAVTKAAPNTTTTYKLTVDSSGFTTVATITARVRAAIPATAQNVIASDVKCNGADNGSVSVAINSVNNNNLNYLWNTGETSSTISNLSVGTYSVTISDSLTGCSSVFSASVSQPSPLTVSIVTADTLLYGEMTANVSGGTENYSFVWNTGETTAAIANPTAGDYAVTVTDKNGCVKTATAVVANQVATGINEVAATTNTNTNAKSVAFTAYPNPAKSDITVEMETSNNGVIVSLKSVLGQTLISYTSSGVQSKIDLSEITSGVYFVVVTDGANTSVKEIVVKK